jgi:outer membrane protein with beta-barrel domain
MRRVLSFAAFALLAIASTASAQRTNRGRSTLENPSPELGVDAGLMFTLDDPKVTVFSLPIQGIRAGFFVSPAVEIEPSLRLNSVSVSGGGSETDYGVAVGLLYHFSTSRAANQLYVRPFIGVDGTSGGGQSSSVFDFGGGFGVKVPVGDRFASRFEANLTHSSQNGISQNAIGLLAGLSVYTH